MSVIVTYIAPADDAPFVEIFGMRFMDGNPVEIETCAENAHVIEKLRSNQHFDVMEDDEDISPPPKKRGPKPKAVEPITIDNEGGE